MSKPTVKRTERGWAGHFCAALKCAYRRNTLLESNDRRVVVSSVGAYRPTGGDTVDEIGCGRYYETMAFVAGSNGLYWDADVSRQIEIQSKDGICAGQPCELPPDVDSLADEMHEGVVEEIAGKLARDEPLRVFGEESQREEEE